MAGSKRPDSQAQLQAAAQETRTWVNRLTVKLLFHIEHHLYPAVPANHLPELARRLDRLAPRWTSAPVLGRHRG